VSIHKINGQYVDHSSNISYNNTVVVVSIDKEMQGVVLCCEEFFHLQMMGVSLSVANEYALVINKHVQYDAQPNITA
jgi:hypothetical protein